MKLSEKKYRAIEAQVKRSLIGIQSVSSIHPEDYRLQQEQLVKELRDTMNAVVFITEDEE